MAHLFKILCSSDLHGVVYPYTYTGHQEKKAGFARLKTLIDRYRDADTLLIDNGDTIQGSPLTLYHQKEHPLDPSPISKIMKQIGYDFIGLGNHDFNYGTKTLFRHIEDTGALCLCANVTYEGQLLGPEYVLKTIDDKKIGIFGITTHYVPNWEKAENIEGLSFEDAHACAVRIVHKLKNEERADYVICVYHGGLEADPVSGEPTEADNGENQGYRIMKDLPEITAFLCGHQHRVLKGFCNGIPYLQPGFEGAWLSYLELDPAAGEVRMELLANDLEADEGIMKLCQAEEDELQRWLDTPLGHTAMDLKIHDEFRDRFHKSQLVTLVNKIQLEASGAAISACSLSYGSCGLEKDITMRDLLGTYSFPNTLFVKLISGKVLKEYLEQCAAFWQLQDGQIVIDPRLDNPGAQYHNYDMLDGIEYVIKVSEPVGQRIVSLSFHGQPVKDGDTFTIALNSYRAAGGGNFPLIKELPAVKEIQQDIAEMIGEYIQNKKEISFTPVNNISIIV